MRVTPASADRYGRQRGILPNIVEGIRSARITFTSIPALLDPGRPEVQSNAVRSQRRAQHTFSGHEVDPTLSRPQTHRPRRWLTLLSGFRDVSK